MENPIKITANGFDVFDSVDVSIGPLTVIEGGSSTGKSRIRSLVEDAHKAIHSRRRCESELKEYVENALLYNFKNLGTGLNGDLTRYAISLAAEKISLGIYDFSAYDLEKIGVTRDDMDRVLANAKIVSFEAYAKTLMEKCGWDTTGGLDIIGAALTIGTEKLGCKVDMSERKSLKVLVIDSEFVKDLHRPLATSPAQPFWRKNAEEVKSQISTIVSVISECHNPYCKMHRESEYYFSSLATLRNKTGVHYCNCFNSNSDFMLQTNIYRDREFVRQTDASKISDSEAFVALTECIINEGVISDDILLIIDTPEAFADDETVETVLSALYPVTNDKNCPTVVFTRRKYSLPDGAIRVVASKTENGVSIKEARHDS